MTLLRTAPLLVLAACGTALTWDADWVEDPAPSGPPELRAYKNEHYRALGREIVARVTFEQFRTELDSSRVLFLGDRHEDRDLHDAQLTLLRDLADGGRRLSLAIEAIGVEDQPDVDRYLAGGIDLRELRQRVRSRWPDSWLDREDVDGAFYRDLLRFGREHRMPVRALEPVPRRPLESRDAIMAKNIRALLADEPDRLCAVVVGHVHVLGAGHLVARVGGSATVVVAAPNRSLEAARALPSTVADTARFERTDTGALLFSTAALRGSRDG